MRQELLSSLESQEAYVPSLAWALFLDDQDDRVKEQMIQAYSPSSDLSEAKRAKEQAALVQSIDQRLADWNNVQEHMMKFYSQWHATFRVSWLDLPETS
jgi:hypothetical protein